MKPIPGALLSALILFAPISVEASRPEHTEWAEVEEAVLPLRKNTTRNAEILGLVRRGQVLAVERIDGNWFKVRVDDTLAGWVPAASMSPSGPPVRVDPAAIKWIIAIFAGIGVSIFLYLGISLWRRGEEGRKIAHQARSDSKRRLQNKVQMLFHSEPRIRSHLAMGDSGMRDFLQGLGYVANLEKDPDRFLASCKTFRPNLILAGFEFRDRIESMAETDAMLINTPMVFLDCAQSPDKTGDRVRAYLEANASEKEIGEAIARCLRKSPRTIRFSVKPVALKGAINSGTLVELLHFLAEVKKSGRLLVASGAEAGEVVLRNGDLAESSLGAVSGRKAAEEILNLSSGSFEFHEEPAKPSLGTDAPLSTVGTLNTQKILMDWAKGRDESDNDTRA